MLELGDLVVREVDHAEGRVLLEAAQIRDGVVREIDFFEVWEVREAADVREAVGLDGEDAEVLEGVEVLLILVLALSCALGGVRGRTLSSVILFFPSQSSSSEVRVSRFSISCITTVNIIHPLSLSNNTIREEERKYPNTIRPQLQIPQQRQPLHALDRRDLILHKIQIRQFDQMRNVLNMLDLIEAEVEARQVLSVLEAFDVRNQVIVEVELE